MVTTRGKPQEVPASESSPSRSTPSRARNAQAKPWAHTPSNLAIGWLFVSLPLVIWDAAYVMLRPLSMPGGSLHWPLWAPYERYGKVDYIYGWKAFYEQNGFTAAQTALNIVETLMYMYYLYILFTFGRQSKAQGRGAPKPSAIGFLGEQRAVEGQQGAIAVVVGYSAAVMTFSKTLLYWLNEYYSGFHNIGHNSARDLIFLWIIPNGAWLVLPSYMIYMTGSEILQGLMIAGAGPMASPDNPALLKAE
ncbi:hypothetical protein QTJ16_002126 [Diplocarpon rosae]|uniref:C6 transcription factor n=1 Tax=Diplocarpon rosae TaxID=946125 RepID=A0AAD9T533_9HELO|nr:hypothetical protein QTJ16_002126 [Diplocarpon rosae]PBP18025.1 hypothetical protein BUE80_DR011181 [Diplocarpon rosae]